MNDILNGLLPWLVILLPILLIGGVTLHSTITGFIKELRTKSFNDGWDSHKEYVEVISPPEREPEAPLEPLVPQRLMDQAIVEAKAEFAIEKNNALNETERKWEKKVKALEDSFKDKEKKIRADAITRHKNVTKGKVTEHLVPYFDDFEYNPSDCRFMGSPIDIVVFDGLSDGADEVSVVFLEVKTGDKANLSTRERRVRDAINEGRVSWKLLRKKG